MFYLAKIDNEEFEKFKNKKGEISIKFRMAGWIKKLSNEWHFNRFFTEERKKRCSEKWPTDVEDTRKYYSVIIDEKDWRLFFDNCRSVKIYANSALNELIKEYNLNGDLFEIKIKV